MADARFGWMLGTMRTTIERMAPAGFMTPLHTRDEDESYRVLEGAVTFFAGDAVVNAAPGDVVDVPRGVARALRADSAGTRWLVYTRVSELDRFVDFGRAVSAPLGDPKAGWPSPEEQSSLAAIARANAIELLGPPGALPA
jgi:hypothetical protein